jgi:hypothetical protein
MIARGEMAEARAQLLQTLANAQHPLVLDAVEKALKRTDPFWMPIWRNFWALVFSIIPAALAVDFDRGMLGLRQG